MRGKTTIVINGRRYDAATGLSIDEENARATPERHVGNDMTTAFVKPIPAVPPTHRKNISIDVVEPKTSRTPAAHIHGSPQRSQTLVRSAVKKPTASHPVQRTRNHVTVSQSPHITKFAPHPQPIEKRTAAIPVAVRTSKVHRHGQTLPVTMPTKQISSRAIKEHLINEQLEKASPAVRDGTYAPPTRARSRFVSLATASFALVLLGGYLTYLNMPSLSIRVAAAQAGIDATLPEYHPDGYRFNGPVAYSQGEVDITFSANAGPQSYTISQKASDWDSQAVLDNYVMKESNGEYNIHSTQGLTVYTFDSKAAWVNNGILHTVDYGDAPLSYSQIERIAASM
jgi:hypothetical protein